MEANYLLQIVKIAITNLFNSQITATLQKTKI